MTQHKLIPPEPTEEMIRAMEREWITGSSVDMAKREYKAMFAAAAPQPTQAAPAPAEWPKPPPRKGQSPVLFEDGYEEGWAKCIDAIKAMRLPSAPQGAVAELVEALDRAIKALKFYADGDSSVLLTGFKNGKRINWKEEQKSLEERGFSRVCELYNGSEEWAENGQVAQTAIDSIKAALISYQEQKQ